MELADVTDSKSVDSDIVWVRPPSPAPKNTAPIGAVFFILKGVEPNRATALIKRFGESFLAGEVCECKRSDRIFYIVFDLF